jgi:hypothetical protein
VSRQAIAGDDLKALVDLGRSGAVTIVLDEFYSSYAYDVELGKSLSAAEYVEGALDVLLGAQQRWIGPYRRRRRLRCARRWIDQGVPPSSPCEWALRPLEFPVARLASLLGALRMCSPKPR